MSNTTVIPGRAKRVYGAFAQHAEESGAPKTRSVFGDIIEGTCSVNNVSPNARGNNPSKLVCLVSKQKVRKVVRSFIGALATVAITAHREAGKTPVTALPVRVTRFPKAVLAFRKRVPSLAVKAKIFYYLCTYLDNLKVKALSHRGNGTALRCHVDCHGDCEFCANH